MYLKSIEVHGFKSFANKINFQFHNGITGIVGPNGSGKSNVADAVRWVLGEQSAKQLRGSSMQDVIFSGTENRKPQGYASVDITLDNSDHQLPVDYEEVTVARRVYRSGESEYLINGVPCRLKDVHELFYDTGIGKEGYSIIGQGQIDRILSGKPEERRELFDEAAGIVKFKRRKAAAVKKLTDEEGNLVRVNDILGELEGRVGPLERQAEKAKIFLKKREELKVLDINAFLLETERLQTQLEETEKKFAIANDDLKNATGQYEDTKEDFQDLQGKLDELEELLENKRQEIAENDITRQKLTGQVNVLNEQINSANASDEHYQNRKNAIASDLEQKEKELREVKKRKKDIDEKTQEAIENRDDAKESQQALSASIMHLNASIEKSKQSIISGMNARDDISTRLGQCDTMLEQIEIRKAELNSRLLRAKSDDAELEANKKKYEEAFKKICDEIRVIDEKIAQKEVEIGKKTEEISEKESQLSMAQTKFHEYKSKLDTLVNLSERYEGYGNSVRKVMDRKDRNVCGVVADLFKVDKKYETAIETALGGNIQNIVTEDEDSAKAQIRFLKENKLGRATFLPLTAVKEREFNAPEALKGKGVIGLADTLVKVDKKYANVVSHLLHNYIVVDNVDNAIALARKFNYTLRCVTIGGEALNPGGSISGGAFKNNSNLLGRGREIDELKKNVEESKKNIDSLLDEIEILKDGRKKLRSESEDIKTSLQDKFIEQNTAKLNVDQAKQRQEETRRGYDLLHIEESEIASKVAEIESQKKNIAKELEQSQKSEVDIKARIDEQSRILEERRQREADILASLSELDIAAAEFIQKQEFESKNVERIESEKKRLLEEMHTIDEFMKQTTAEVAQKKEDIAKLEETIKASLQASEDGKKFILQQQELKEQISKDQQNFLSKREELSGRMNSLDKEVYRLTSQIEKLKDNTEAKHSYMWNEYEITMSQAKELRNPEMNDLAGMNREIIAVKASIRELGDVNVNAIEEYRELMERYEFLSTQRNDLVEAKASLEKVIAELDEGMRRQFTDKFGEIASQFDKVFKELFGGGKGTLELMEDEDILEAGIKIIAQPPGKKLQNMMQLSGGEKALTAIALLFAIQNLKPSPFCLLDEIEAALDESNVGRFAGYLQKLTKNTQFIVITHRRGTMEKADRLYGITMQEKGVSALVSVNLIDDKDLK